MNTEKTYQKKDIWEKPEVKELGDAKDLINAEFSEIFDQKNSAVQADFFNANVS